jgi:hypothetical protein
VLRNTGRGLHEDDMGKGKMAFKRARERAFSSSPPLFSSLSRLTDQPTRFLP